MIRTPSPREPLYAWWRGAVEACGSYGNLREAFDAGRDIPETEEAAPQCGFYRVRAGRDRPYVPARIYLEQHVDQDGQLTQPEQLRCQVGDDFYDPEEKWLELCNSPISRAQYEYMMDVRDWAADFAPHAPEAHPFKPIDYLNRPPPVFKKRRRR